MWHRDGCAGKFWKASLDFDDLRFIRYIGGKTLDF
jgi:hypothetical protein